MPHENAMDLWLENIVPLRKAGDFFQYDNEFSVFVLSQPDTLQNDCFSQTYGIECLA